VPLPKAPNLATILKKGDKFTYKYFFNNKPNFSLVEEGTLSSCVKIANFNAE
jgi:hypothetical protein